MKNFHSLFQKAQSLNLIDKFDDAVLFYDLGTMGQLLERFAAHFPANHNPTVAVKTCPLLSVLQQIGTYNFGHEAASLSEVIISGQQSDQLLVYDGPAKEIHELELILPYKERLIINANSFGDLKKIQALSFPNIGLRINPRVVPRVEKRFDVSQSGSQFGVPLDFKKEIITAYSRDKRLNTIHFHLGSGMASVSPFEQALQLVEPLLREIEVARSENGLPPLKYIDIGGGLLAEPLNKDMQRAQRLGTLLKERFGHLWEKYTLITEMGQYIHTHVAWLCTKIADILYHRKRPILIAHSGANMFPRQAYTNTPPPFTYANLRPSSSSSSTQAYDIAGPLCFAGDRVEENVSLPTMNPGEWLVVDSVGANTFSLYSMHCSWLFPKVIGYDERKNTFKILKERMRTEDVIKFWS
jgi:diaminopimelate decarboxylase